MQAGNNTAWPLRSNIKVRSILLPSVQTFQADFLFTLCINYVSFGLSFKKVLEKMGIGTLDRKMTSFRQSENIIML